MKKTDTLFFTLLTAAILLPTTARGANEIPVHLRIENESGTDVVTTVHMPDECDVTDTTTTTPAHFSGYKAICAVQTAQDQGLLTYQATNWGFGFALDSINSTVNATDWSKTWLLYRNLQDPGMGIDGFSLQAEDELLLTYAGWPNSPLRVSAATTTVQEGEVLTLEATTWDTNTQALVPVSTAVTFHIGDESFPMTGNSTLDWTATNAGDKRVWVEGAGFTRSAAITVHVTALPAPREIIFRVETASSTLAAADISLPYQCDIIDSVGTLHRFTGYKAVCALQTAQTTSIITDFQITNWGFAFALDKINNIANAVDWSQTWLLFHNLKDPGVGIDSVVLEDQDELLLTYAGWPTRPLRLTTAPVTVDAGNTVEITVETWNTANNVFELLSGVTSTVWIGGSPFETASGTVSWIATNGDTQIFAETSGATRSAISLYSTTTPPPPAPPASSGGGGCGSCGAPPTSGLTMNMDTAVVYLQQKQLPDGSILGSHLYSDWTAIAFASYNGQNTGKETLKQYLLSDPTAIVGFNEAADYARRAMALLALGINPYSGTRTNYIEKLIGTFDGNQFGDVSLINDDIFALFPLLHSGYGGSDQIIASTTAFVLSKQESNGSWGSVDMTAAAIQALAPLHMLPNVSSALSAAKTFLHNEQRSNGSFADNTDSTSWAVQAIAALNENESLWKKNATPGEYLASKQLSDGSIGDSAAPESVRAWSTAYAIPAAQGKSWKDILTTVSKPTSPLLPLITSPNTNPTNVFLPTSTEATTTSTVEITTSTLNILATTTPEIAPTLIPINEIQIATPIAIDASASIAAQPEQRIISPGAPVEAPVILQETDETATDKPVVPTQEILSADIAPNNPVSAAKRVLAVTATTAGGVGLYLGWRFLQSLV